MRPVDFAPCSEIENLFQSGVLTGFRSGSVQHGDTVAHIHYGRTQLPQQREFGLRVPVAHECGQPREPSLVEPHEAGSLVHTSIMHSDAPVPWHGRRVG